MNFRHSLPTRWQVALVALLAAVCLTGTPSQAVEITLNTKAAPAERLEALGTSLNLIPENAAFYSVSLRNREQIEAIAKSRAWAKLMEMPVVKMAWQKYEKESGSPNDPATQMKMALSNPNTQEFLALLGDMFSEDFFVYGDADMVDFTRLMQEINAVTSYGPIMMKINGHMEGLTDEQAQVMFLIAALSENIDRLKVPSMVMGFKVKDRQRVMAHLGKLELVAGLALTQAPKLSGAIKHEKIDGHDYLVLRLKGDMLPWDEMELDKARAVEIEKGSVDKLVEKAKSESIVIALGLRDDYFLFSMGSSTKVLENLGKSPSLASRPELVPVAKYADRPVISIDYISGDFLEALNANRQKLNDLVDFANQALPSLKVTDEQKEQIEKDVTELADMLKKKMPVVGAMSAVSFLTDGGIESYSYDWSTHPGFNSGKPLGLLSHVGGSPIMALVARGTCSLQDYDLMVKWLGKGYGYFEEYAIPQMDEDDKEKYDQCVELFGPLLTRLNQANREMFLPALDGQFGVVLDGQLKSKQFIKTLPATKEAMPMAEPAILVGVRDSKLMHKALVEYWSLIKDSLTAAAQLNPEANEIELPEPETIDTANGELFAFVPPDECPMDKQVTPNVGLGKDVLVFSMSQAHSERLMKATPLAVGGLLADPDRPLGAAGVFDWPALLRAAQPWVDLAVDKAIEENLGPDAPDAIVSSIKDQVQTVMEVLGVLRGVTLEAYMEEGVMVTHTLSVIKDVD